MSDRPTVAVGAVIVEDDRLLLVERTGPPAPGRWAVPGGRVETGETLAEAVRREAVEETGLVVDVGEVAWLGESIGTGTPPGWHFVIVDFWATRLSGTLRAASDAGRAAWVPIKELCDWPIAATMHELVAALWPEESR